MFTTIWLWQVMVMFEHILIWFCTEYKISSPKPMSRSWTGVETHKKYPPESKYLGRLRQGCHCIFETLGSPNDWLWIVIFKCENKILNNTRQEKYSGAKKCVVWLCEIRMRWKIAKQAGELIITKVKIRTGTPDIPGFLLSYPINILSFDLAVFIVISNVPWWIFPEFSH